MTSSRRHALRARCGAAALGVALLLGGCQTLNIEDRAEEDTARSVRDMKPTANIGRPLPPAAGSGALSGGALNPVIDTQPSELGRVPFISERTDAVDAQADGRAPRLGATRVDAFVPAMPLPQFIDVVFGEILDTPYVTGPAVAARTDIVQLRSSGTMGARDFLSLIDTALREYGVRVVPENGTYRILEDSSLRARIPRFIRSRARAETRDDLRPVIQFVELEALDANSMFNFLQQAFGRNNDKISFTSNPLNNFITLSGLPADVDAALAIILELDELNYAGTQVERYSPRYWSADELVDVLAEALTVEGWQVSTSLRENRTIALLPVAYSNDIFIFSRSAEAKRRTEAWLRELDRPVEGGDATQLYIYQVKNVAAADLAGVANAVLAGTPRDADRAEVTRSPRRLGGGPSEPIVVDPEPTSGFESATNSGEVFIVEPIGNRLVYSATAAEFDRYNRLLERLDSLAPEVLIEVQIVEVSLTEDVNSGVELFIDDIGDENVQAVVGTTALDLGTSGLDVRIASGNVSATINALQQNRRVKLLSTPVLTARSGGTAEIQVGTDVPIITAQRAANNQNGVGAVDILQSVDYRETGVILSIEPVVFSGDRVDLTISQEVSSTLDTASSEISSPTISNRSIATQLTLQDGSTAILGGLIQENTTRDDDGIPLIKDIPVIGKAFSSQAVSIDRTELVVLITAYVLRGQQDMDQFVNTFRGRIDSLMAPEDRTVDLRPRS